MPEHTGEGECLEAARQTSVAVEAIVISSMTENIRCVRLATGQVVYEFWTDGRKIARIDADAYDFALTMARGELQA
jgi:hypothetical protein